jgi:hypothetical protein
MEITGSIAIGNGEKCPFCPMIQGKDFDEALEHLDLYHPKRLRETLFGKTDNEVAGVVENECFFCHENAEVKTQVCPSDSAEGSKHTSVAYYRAKLPSGKWDSVPICITCLKEKQPRFRD